MRATALWGIAIVFGSVACTRGDDAVMGEADASAAEGVAGEPGAGADVDPASLERWSVRLDDAQAAGDFLMVEEAAGWHITTGPAGITWRPADFAESGDFTARATFTESAAEPGHREAYGLLLGGYHLESPDQKYTYFLVRGSGEYLIKQRDGEETRTLVDWTASDAVDAIEEAGEVPTNALEVRVEGDSVEFVVNGQVVETLPVERVGPYGLVGLRVNHHLDIEVSDFEVVEAAAEAGQLPEIKGAGR